MGHNRTPANCPPGRFRKNAAKAAVCPFCPGNESLTPPEVYRIGPGVADSPGWQVRVVPNKYPITDVHEVIIHSSSDTDDVEKLSVDHVAKILTCYRDRYRAHEADGQVLIFCNHGFHAGASLKHPHSQLVVVPKQINLDALSREPITSVVEENTFLLPTVRSFPNGRLKCGLRLKLRGRSLAMWRMGRFPIWQECCRKLCKRSRQYPSNRTCRTCRIVRLSTTIIYITGLTGTSASSRAWSTGRVLSWGRASMSTWSIRRKRPFDFAQGKRFLHRTFLLKSQQPHNRFFLYLRSPREFIRMAGSLPPFAPAFDRRGRPVKF